MNTHDEDTRHFFKFSSVRVILCPRSGGKGRGLLKRKVSQKYEISYVYIYLHGNGLKRITIPKGKTYIC